MVASLFSLQTSKQNGDDLSCCQGSAVSLAEASAEWLESCSLLSYQLAAIWQTHASGVLAPGTAP